MLNNLFFYPLMLSSFYTARVKHVQFPGMRQGGIAQPHVNEGSVLQSQERHLATLISVKIHMDNPFVS